MNDIIKQTPVRDRLKEFAENWNLARLESLVDESKDRAERRREYLQLGIDTGIIDGSNLKKALSELTDYAIEEMKTEQK